jgi:hypothetical protein
MADPFIDDPEHWLQRAQEAHTLADQMSEEAFKRAMLRIAAEYERLAKRASRRRTGQKAVVPTLRAADVLAMVRVTALKYLGQELTFPLPTKDGGVLRTVGDVDAYMQALPDTRRCNVDWQRVRALLLRRKAQHVAALTRRAQVALFLDTKLDDGQFRPNVSSPHWLRRRRHIPSS